VSSFEYQFNAKTKHIEVLERRLQKLQVFIKEGFSKA